MYVCARARVCAYVCAYVSVWGEGVVHVCVRARLRVCVVYMCAHVCVCVRALTRIADLADLESTPFFCYEQRT